MASSIFTFKLTGLKPLLMNNPAKMPPPGGPKVKHIPLPKEEAAAKVYMMPNGQLYIPAYCLRASFLAGCKGLMSGKMGLGAALAGVVTLPDDDARCPLFHPKTRKPIKKYDIDSRRAVVGKGAGVVRSRPKVPEWCCEVALLVDMEFVPDTDLIPKTFTRAGVKAGTLDFRPEKRGTFGKYTAELVSIKDIKE